MSLLRESFEGAKPLAEHACRGATRQESSVLINGRGEGGVCLKKRGRWIVATFREDNGIILRGKANENICADIREWRKKSWMKYGCPKGINR